MNQERIGNPSKDIEPNKNSENSEPMNETSVPSETIKPNVISI